MILSERFNKVFKREPTEKEIEVLKRVDDTWYGEHMDWNSSLFVNYFCDYYFEMYRENCSLKLPREE